MEGFGVDGMYNSNKVQLRLQFKVGGWRDLPLLVWQNGGMDVRQVMLGSEAVRRLGRRTRLREKMHRDKPTAQRKSKRRRR
jgi:hypothetical protein